MLRVPYECCCYNHRLLLQPSASPGDVAVSGPDGRRNAPQAILWIPSPGQPPHLQVHIDLNDLRGASVVERVWTPAMAAAGPGSVCLTGPAAEAAACDAVLTPMVTGQIDWAVLDQLTTLSLTAHGHAGGPQQSRAGARPEGHPGGPRESQADGRAESREADQPAARPGHVPGPATGPFPGPGHPPGPGDAPAADEHDCALSGCLEATRQRLQATLLRWSLDLWFGPGGLAGHLRGTLPGAPFNTLSQPLDLGRATRTIPPHLRTAVIQRDKHCQFPGCTQPPSVCEVHHLIPWTKGGPTSLGNLRLLCRFHHLIVIHRWGWTITCHPDGTRTATSPDGRTLHSHGPPPQAA
jgi:HNH endonuclease